ncbi:accessory factor UbiK family protein [Pontibacterium granulatum]|uniref:accessory factor UbiK family protein n=1 Tax=Pontibacterium granulatum TaxID=2036029 RepID=UPI00249A4D82|nr:accessory factor UbiK family protein [Pontibacterium granulatum]MDI3324580.1 accessory factor UbiK family protein [Pontibacterium granulatum]
MINQKLIDGLSEQFSQLMSGKANLPGEEMMKEQVSAILQGTFNRLDLVTRDEFDAQKAVLMRTREKVEQLEALVTEMEQKLSERDA